MTNRFNDPLLAIGRTIALILQGLSALAMGIFVLLTVWVTLNGMGLLPDVFEGSEGPAALMFPLPNIGLGIVLALLCAALFLFFGRLRAFIKTVGEGDAFIPENAKRLQTMAWLVLAVQALAILVGALRDYIAGLILNVESRFYVDFGRNDMVGLLMVIILFILARSFRHGTEMREDLEGTV